MNISNLLAVVLLFSMICLFYGLYKLVEIGLSFENVVRIATSQLQQSERGLVIVQQPDIFLVLLFSVISLVVGIAIGFVISKATVKD